MSCRHSWMKSKTSEGDTQLCLVAGNSDIRSSDCQTEASTYGGTIDGSNDRNWKLSHNQESLVELLHHVDVVLRSVSVSSKKPVKITSSTESLPCSCQDSSPNISVTFQLVYS